MKKFLISLDKDIKRRELFFSQANTEDFEVFRAINTMNEDWSNLSNHFNISRFEQRYGRKVTKGEIGCTLSHLSVYERIANNPDIQRDEYVLICEDDALFAENFQQHLNAILQQNLTADIILVGQSKIPHFEDKELLINYPSTFKSLQKQIGNSPYYYSYPYKNYFAGTVAYLIKKSTAIQFLNEIKNTVYWLADDYVLFGEQFGMDILVIRPLLVIENPNLVSNLEDLRGSLNNNLVKKLFKYPLKKLLAIKRNLALK